MPLIANDIAFPGGTTVAYVTAYGSDAVFRVEYAADGTFVKVGSSTQNFINLAPGSTTFADGNLPVGIAMANAGAATSAFSLVINENSRNLSVVSLSSQVVVATTPSADAPPAVDATKPSGSVYDVQVNKGKRFFVTGRARWSLKGQAWNSCESCHPDGLTDNVTWYFGRGPRQTTSLDGTYDPKDPTRRRILNWSGIFDEVHDFELNTRGNSGGIGAIVWQVGAPAGTDDRIVIDSATAPTGTLQKPSSKLDNGLNGSTIGLMPKSPATPCAAADATCDNSVLGDWNDINTFVKFIRAPMKPTNLDATLTAAGKTLFTNNGCTGCHGGTQWTISHVFYSPGETNNNPSTGTLITTDYNLTTGFPIGKNPPANGAGKAKIRLSPFSGANDQINCILRDVGTFPAGTVTTPVAPTGIILREVRPDMTTQAQGATGFNPPSLLGMVTGAPYFHGGNARTLEEVFDTTFVKHHQAYASVFAPTADDIMKMVAFLSSIDETSDKIDFSVTALGFNPELCPTLP